MAWCRTDSMPFSESMITRWVKHIWKIISNQIQCLQFSGVLPRSRKWLMQATLGWSRCHREIWSRANFSEITGDSKTHNDPANRNLDYIQSLVVLACYLQGTLGQNLWVWIVCRGLSPTRFIFIYFIYIFYILIYFENIWTLIRLIIHCCFSVN